MSERISTMPVEIIGHGAIAEALEGIDKPFLFFASGVANSRETRESEFDRERWLLMDQPKDKHIVYFSSLCTIFDPDTRYSMHKMEMEDLIRNYWDSWTIVRIGNITWGHNPNQLVPFIREKVAKGEQFPIYDEYRHILDKDEFRYWVNLIPKDRNIELTMTGRRMKIDKIVEEIVEGKI